MGFSISDLNPLNYVDDAVEWASDTIGLPEGVGDALALGAAYATGDFEGMIDQGLDFGENLWEGVKGFANGVLNGPDQSNMNGCTGYGGDDPLGGITGGESIEELIMKIFQKLEKNVKERLKSEGNRMSELTKGGDTGGAEQAKFELQRVSGLYTEMSKMVSNIFDMTHQTRQGAIDKIGR